MSFLRFPIGKQNDKSYIGDSDEADGEGARVVDPNAAQELHADRRAAFVIVDKSLLGTDAFIAKNDCICWIVICSRILLWW